MAASILSTAMTSSTRTFLKRAASAAALAACFIAAAALSPRWTRYFASRAQAASETDAQSPKLAGKDSLDVPAGIAARLGVETFPAQSATAPVILEMSGTLMFDSTKLSHVRARFPGEIVQLGMGSGQSGVVGFGQKVRKNQLLAVVWSQDLGEKKCELIDALSQLRVDEESLQRIKSVTAEGAVPERLLQDAQRKVEADRIAVSRQSAPCRHGGFRPPRSRKCGPRPTALCATGKRAANSS